MDTATGLAALAIGVLAQCTEPKKPDVPPPPLAGWHLDAYPPQGTAVTAEGGFLAVSGNALLEFPRGEPPHLVAELPSSISVVAPSPRERLIALGGLDDSEDCRGDGQTVERVTVVRRDGGPPLWHVDDAIVDPPRWLDDERLIVSTYDWRPRRTFIVETTYDAASGRALETRRHRDTQWRTYSRAWWGPYGEDAHRDRVKTWR